MSLASSPTHHPLTPHARFSVEQFHRLCEAVPEQRLELIDGEVLEVIAKGTRHSSVVNRLARLITLRVTSGPEDSLELRVESPLHLGGSSEVEPDLALVHRRSDAYLLAHPSAADTVLLIEVADTSLRFDLEAKSRLYDAAGIPNYWVIDVLRPRLIAVLQSASPDSLLMALQVEVETLLAAIPPA
jgi:Uma2 family endonuclease